MAAPFIIPFNFQPVSVSVRTSSYTIPAGKYAYVTVSLDGTGSFSIGGVDCLTATSNNVLGSSPLNYATRGVGGASLSTNENADASTGAAFVTAVHKEAITASYWVPAGTVINGSSFKAVVTEYNNIS